MSRFDPHSWCDDTQAVVVHMDLDWSVDFETRTVSGRATLRLREPAGGPLDLDARGLDIRAVRTDGGAPIPWAIAESEAVRGDRLRLDLPDDTAAI